MEDVNVIIQCLVEDRVMRVCVACAGLVDIHFPGAKDLELLELMVCNSRQACACDGPDHRRHAASSVWICENPCNSNIVVVGVAARKRQSRLLDCMCYGTNSHMISVKQRLPYTVARLLPDWHRPGYAGGVKTVCRVCGHDTQYGKSRLGRLRCLRRATSRAKGNGRPASLLSYLVALQPRRIHPGYWQ